METERLVIRKYEPKDFPNFYRLKSCPEVWTYSTFCPFENQEQAEKAFGNLLEAQQAKDECRIRDKFPCIIGFQAVVEKRTGILIGEAGIIASVPHASRGEIGYNLLPEYWGKGYGTEIARGIVQEAFADAGFERLEALVIADNRASCRVLEKAGFCREGLLRNFNKWESGYRDVCYYGILAEDYMRA